MNIQIFGTKKCNDTKKAERFFKERGIKYQFIDMKEKGMSKGEFNSVAQANGGLENMVNWDGKDKDLLALIKYIADEDKLDKVIENPQVIKTPVVRNGKQSTLGYQPELSLKQIADEVLFMSGNYLSKLFLKETGYKFSTFLTIKRMEKAAQLLRENCDVTVYEVAERTGFGNNPQYFSTVFKKYFGKSPSELREKSI